MDPATVALFAAAALAALQIKRSSRRRPAPSPAVSEPAFSQASVLPSRLDGGGLRPAVTERAEQAEAGGGGTFDTGGGASGRFYLLNGQNAAASGGSADVIGASSDGGSEGLSSSLGPGTTTRPRPTYTPLPFHGQRV